MLQSKGCPEDLVLNALEGTMGDGHAHVLSSHLVKVSLCAHNEVAVEVDVASFLKAWVASATQHGTATSKPEPHPDLSQAVGATSGAFQLNML